ncbi:rhodanese-like domain-containing protein [Enterovibrio sp. 27052020O]|uniref:rhodanese-like domain-containing protein n=1 Tax=Enterovibrio sp. 27052020O TaxID=3241166 RepID=UPI0038902A42
MNSQIKGIQKHLKYAILLYFCAFSVTAETKTEHVSEPDSYRTENYRAPVPNTLIGATVIDTPEALKQFISSHNPRLIDVYPAPNKPDNLLKSTLWIEPKRDTLPGTRWLANVGHGIMPDSLIDLLKKNLPDDQPVVIFCEPNCWHSWNAAKRALELGASEVVWYRAGVTGWREAGFALETHTPIRP